MSRRPSWGPARRARRLLLADLQDRDVGRSDAADPRGVAQRGRLKGGEFLPGLAAKVRHGSVVEAGGNLLVVEVLLQGHHALLFEQIALVLGVDGDRLDDVAPIAGGLDFGQLRQLPGQIAVRPSQQIPQTAALAPCRLQIRAEALDIGQLFLEPRIANVVDEANGPPISVSRRSALS